MEEGRPAWEFIKRAVILGKGIREEKTVSSPEGSQAEGYLALFEHAEPDGGQCVLSSVDGGRAGLPNPP